MLINLTYIKEFGINFGLVWGKLLFLFASDFQIKERCVKLDLAFWIY